jgi:molecular chaperone DnaK
MSNKIIGIDLGTTNSCVAVFEGGEAQVITNAEGKRTTPSVIGFDLKNNERKVGDPAKRQAITNPENTIYSIKRYMGMSYDKVKEEDKNVPYHLINENNLPKVEIDGKKYTPQEISSMILSKMKKTAEDFLGSEVKEAVITVPAYFDDRQRQATIEAGKIAGLDVKRIVNEPTAAALAYGVDKSDKDMKIVVFDFGGGTHDVSILDFGDGVFEVLATGGDTHLGGDDIDNCLIKYMVDDFKASTGIDLNKDPMALQRVKEAAEKAKIELSSSTSTEVNLPYISAADGVPQHLVMTITRAKFEQLIDSIIKRTIEPCKTTLEQAKLSVSDIDEVILVGGSTRIPAVQEAVKNFFGKEPSKGVNPDEVVAIGAAIQGAILNKEEGVGDIVLLDVTPISMGIEAHNQFESEGRMAKIIEAQTTIPTKKSQTFTTAVDNQTAVTIVVLQGERTYAKDCKVIGTFNLEGIAPAKAGVPQIEVTFDIDANGVLNVSAKDKATGKEQKITISNSNLSDAEIEQMKADAEAHKAEDEAKAEKMNKINMAQIILNGCDQALNDENLKDKITQEDRDNIMPLKENLDKLLKEYQTAEDKEKAFNDILTAQKSLEDAWNPVMQKIYAQSNPQGQQANPFGTGGSNPFGDMFNGAQTQK